MRGFDEQAAALWVALAIILLWLVVLPIAGMASCIMCAVGVGK